MSEETYFKGGGLELLVLKTNASPSSFWEVRFIDGIGGWFYIKTRQEAIAFAKQRIIEAIAKEQGMSPKVVKAFMEANESSE